MSTPDIPTPCPACGAYSLAPEGSASMLVAVCDVLVLKTLEQMGKRIVRGERARFYLLGGRPFYVAHTFWPAESAVLDKALGRAWDVVPPMFSAYGSGIDHAGLSAIKVEELLDGYVRDLVREGRAHTRAELVARFRDELSLPVYDRSLPAGAVAGV